jgi:hypothetical protein
LFCAACGNINEATGNERAAMGIFASPGHKFGQLKIHDTAMASSKSPIRSRSLCPHCGSPLYYVNTVFGFLTGHKKRVCLAAKCSFVEQRRFKIVMR